MYWRRMDKTIPRGPARSLETGAETLRSFGDPNSARLWDIAAVELERAQALFADITPSQISDAPMTISAS